jgi:hypothetical protein
MSYVCADIVPSSAIGLKLGWMSFRWVTCLPPMLAIFIFKYALTRTFDRRFRYYLPTEAEIRDAKQHNKDVRKNMLSNRFGHPALHADLFTPMVHANQVALLSQVYAGKTSSTRTKMQEMGGQKVDAVMSGGIKFAAIQQVRTLDMFVLHMLTSQTRINSNTTPDCTSAIVATRTGMPNLS